MKRALVLLSSLLIAGCGDQKTEPPLPRPVVVATAKAVTTETFGPFTGKIESRYQTQLGFQISGRIVSREVYVGDAVKKGQRLAALDPTVTQFELMRAKADVADARAQVANTRGIEERQRTLASGGNATQAALDNAVAGRATAKARLDQAEAGLRRAEDQVAYTQLNANFDAVVTDWSAEVGQNVESGRQVVTLARADVREAVADIPDDLIHELKPDMSFDVKLLAVPGTHARARVREIGPLADDATRSHRIRLSLQDPPAAFRLGATVTMTRDIPTAEYFPVPSSAVEAEGAARFVWLLAPDRHHVERRQVDVAAVVDGIARISKGLKAEDQVVAVGVHSLSEVTEIAGSLSGLETAVAADNGATAR